TAGTADISSNFADPAHGVAQQAHTERERPLPHTGHRARTAGPAGRTQRSTGVKTMRWKKWVGGLALMLATGSPGCRQQVFMTPDSCQSTMTSVVQNLDNNPRVTDTPVTTLVSAPTLPSDPERPPEYYSLAQCI